MQRGKKGYETSHIRRHAPAERTKTKFGMRGRVVCFKFYRNWLMGFRAVCGQNGGGGLPLTLQSTSDITKGQHYYYMGLSVSVRAAAAGIIAANFSAALITVLGVLPVI